MIKKVPFLMILLVVIFTFPCFLSTGVDYNSEADLLKSYGLFSGTNNGYELERVPNRVEAAAMLVKLLGKEEEAKLHHYSHPFTDVPSWANDAIGYMYENKMTTGISSNMFGSKLPMKAKDFTVFALKALGYTGDDFSYTDTMSFAEKMGLYDSKTKTELESVEFKRDEMVHVSYNAINTNLKASTQTLFDKLSVDGVIKKSVDTPTDNSELFLAGKTTRYEKTVKNIDTSGDTIAINTDVVNFKFTKKDGFISIVSYSEPIVVSENPLVTKSQVVAKGIYFNGSRTFPKTYAQWSDSIIYYNLALYKNGVYQTATDFAGKPTQGFGTNFSIPTTDFDEVRVTAYPVDYEFFGTTPDDFVKIYKSTEVGAIMNLIKSGTAISRSGTSIGTDSYASVLDFKLFNMLFYFGGTHYPNGDFIKVNGSKDILPDAALEYSINFVSTGFPQVFMINRDEDKQATSVEYTFFKSKIENSLMLYLIYGDGFKIKNIMIITE